MKKKNELKFTVAERARHWKVSDSYDSASDFERLIVQPGPKGGCYHVASVVLAENAPVLAAAPEMYDVLKKAKKFLGDLSADNVRSRVNEMCDLYGLIRAVVEKADVQGPDGGTKR